MSYIWILILYLLMNVLFAHSAPQIKIAEKESKGQSFVETHNNLLEWLNFFDDYSATSTTPAPQKVTEKADPIETDPQPSLTGGTRDGQTLKIQVPTFSASASQGDSHGSKSKTTIKKPRPVDSQGSRNGQTLTSQGDSQGSKRKPTPQKPKPNDSQGSKRVPHTSRPGGTRDGQTAGIPIPKFSESTSQSDSHLSKRKPTLPNISPLNPQASRSGQTHQNGNPLPSFMEPDQRQKTGQASGNPSESRRDGENVSENSFESFMGPGPNHDPRRQGQSSYGPPNDFRHQYSPYGHEFEYRPYPMPFYPPNPYQYQTPLNRYPYLPVTPYDDEHMMYYLMSQSPARPSRAPNSLSRTCSNDELEDLIGQKMEKLTNTTNLPGFRCHQKDFYQPGRCVESTCAQVRFCGIVGQKIKGRCKGFTGNYDKLCCMA